VDEEGNKEEDGKDSADFSNEHDKWRWPWHHSKMNNSKNSMILRS
jgi:hypothetical protein